MPCAAGSQPPLRPGPAGCRADVAARRRFGKDPKVQGSGLRA